MTNSFARIAYEAYGEKAHWKTYDDKPMPDWEHLGAVVQVRWEAAANAVMLATGGYHG